MRRVKGVRKGVESRRRVVRKSVGGLKRKGERRDVLNSHVTRILQVFYATHD